MFAIFPVQGGRGVESRLTVDGLNISNPPGGNQPSNYVADIGNSSEATMTTSGGLAEAETMPESSSFRAVRCCNGISSR